MGRNSDLPYFAGAICTDGVAPHGLCEGCAESVRNQTGVMPGSPEEAQGLLRAISAKRKGEPDNQETLRAERDALRVELNASSTEMARACVQIDDLRAERKELRELCRIGGNALSAIKRGVADAYHEHRCEYEPCVVCELHALVEECTKIPDGK